ncbi:MAG: hypothetical protein IID34_18065 [Planctomycetes bacterium]|nr:hypothetical protein [Planctomycetota bacterium]
MHHAEPILVRNEHDRPHHWRRFLAALCFMEFYVTFVYAGMAIWDDDPGLWFNPWTIVLEAPWVRIPLLVGAAMLYLCGRGLWRGGRSTRFWLWFGVVSLFLMVACEVVAGATWRSPPSPFFAPPEAPTLGRAIMLGFYLACVHWLLLVVLAFAVWLTRPNNRLLKKTTAPWVYCAAAYCLVSILAGYFGHDSTAFTLAGAMFQWTSNPGFFMLAGFISAALLIATATALLCRRRFARTGALIIAAINIVGVWHNWYPISMLVRIAIRAMWMSQPLAGDIDEGMIWLKRDFVLLFVDPVRLVGPWLLIAIYAWKAPMRKPPDDGTPFPRRFCGNCYYNLHGIEASRCPECGTGFEHPVG